MNDANTTYLQKLFGDNNRAEWRTEDFKELFVRPTYLNKLESLRPCFLVGGRGTGKTTSLQSLKYDATYDRLIDNDLGFDDQEYLGVLIRINKNRVHAFQGGGIDESSWGKSFAHYFNLLVCLELADLTIWLEKISGVNLTKADLQIVCSDFGITSDINNSSELKSSIKLEISKLQLYVNHPKSNQSLSISIAEAPIRTFVEVLSSSGISGNRTFFCCIDEYENLLDYQQAVLNTYIKHASPPLSYKVGVRKNGLRIIQTLDRQDPLRTPDDFAEIEISDEGFEYFAKAVAEVRLKKARKDGIPIPESLSEFLEELSFSKEAVLLGSERIANQVLEELRVSDKKAFDYFNNKPSHETYFLKYWQLSDGGSIFQYAHEWMNNEGVWYTKLNNHGYASLFWLSDGHKGLRIKKYYCGERIFLILAAGNIRYFLELLDAAVNYQLEEKNSNENFKISPKSQTLAARDVGRRRLDQLEDLADNGVQLKRLVLAIGKVFFEMARSPIGRAPETISFVINGNDPSQVSEIQQFLSEGVGHLAFEAAPRTKATSDFEIKDEEYRLHRIFSAFFEISHRKKRRITFDASDLINILKDKPAKAISSILGNIDQTDEKELPEQLAFFNAFYDEGVDK